MRKGTLIVIFAVLVLFTGCASSNIERENDTTTEVEMSKKTGTVVDQKMNIQFYFGGKTGEYTGDLFDGVPHGNGTFVCNNKGDNTGWTYKGEWDNGHMEGNGTCIWTNGDSYYGEYSSDLMDGKGKFYSKGKLVYEGEFNKGEFETTKSKSEVDNQKDTTKNVDNLSEKEFKKSCKEYKYKDLLRNPGKYQGKTIKITIKIAQQSEDSYSKKYRSYANDDSGLWFGDEYYINDLRKNAEPKFLNDDVITVYGIFTGTQKIQRSLTGEVVELPYISMKYGQLHK